MSSASWTAEAREDLGRIDDYYRALDPGVAHEIGSRAIAAGRFLAEHPFAGAPLDDGENRKWRVPRTPYLLLYRVLNDRVQILRVRHTAEDWRA